MERWTGICAGAVLAGWLAGCAATGPRTEIESTWTDATYADGGFERVAVLANFDTQVESRVFEENVARALEARGVTAIEGRRVVEDGRRYSEEALELQLSEVDADGILILKLIAVEEDLTYRRPYAGALPPDMVFGDPYFWYYYPHWSYYSYWRSARGVVRAPGYWEEVRHVIVEASLYDNRTDQLVWTAKTETMDTPEYGALAASIAGAVTERLADLDLIGGEDAAA